MQGHQPVRSLCWTYEKWTKSSPHRRNDEEDRMNAQSILNTTSSWNDTSTCSGPHRPPAPPAQEHKFLASPRYIISEHSNSPCTLISLLCFKCPRPLPGVHESLEVRSSIFSACLCSRPRRPLRMCLEHEGRCESRPWAWMKRKHASKYFTDLA